MDTILHDSNQNDHNDHVQLEHDNTKNKEHNSDDFQYVSRQNRKRRNDNNDQDNTTNSSHTPKRRNSEQTINSSRKKIALSYFNNNRTSNKQIYESSTHNQIYESSSRKQNQRDSFPPFRIIMKDDGMYPTQDVAIIKEMNKACKLNLTYGRMSTSKTNRCYLLYCNTSAQFEYLLDKTNWPEKLCDCDFTLDLPQRIPSAYSVVMLNVPTQWDVQSFCDELKLQYKTIIKCERLFVRGGRPIPKIRIDFSSNKELSEVLKNKRMLLDDENTAYQIEPYVPPPRVLRCYICQQYDDHIAAHCPNKDKPICFKCGQQHPFNSECQNKICCAHCNGNHMAGNPSCPKKIESRELKKTKAKPSLAPTTYSSSTNIWTGNSPLHLFDNSRLTPLQTSNNLIDNNHSLQLLDTINLNIQSLLRQQVDLNKNFNELTARQNNQAKEIINISQALSEFVCPLLKEVTHIVYTQINSQQKRQIDSSYNKLVKYRNQKDPNYAFLNVTHANNFSQEQQQQTRSKTSTSSNDFCLNRTMNPYAKEFFPNHTEPFHIPVDQLSQKQVNLFQELINEWTTTPTLNSLQVNWEERRKRTLEMMNTKSGLKIMLLNVSSLKLYLPDIFVLLEKKPCSIVVFNGTHHNDEAVKMFTKHYSNYNIYSEKGTNDFGGVLIAVHRSIPTQRVDIYQNQNLPNVIVLDIGTSSDKFQLATCYSPPKEALPISLFDKVLKRNLNTILLGDFNAKHKSWSNTAENHKGRTLFNWLSTNTLTVVNKLVATSTRSNATIDLILAPTHMTPSSSSFCVLPSIGSDHLPVLWTPTIKLLKRDCLYPVKRTY